MTQYEPHGPLPIKPEALYEGKKVLKGFWNEHADHLASRRGIYVFGIRAGKGITPWYVGQTQKSFRQEVFQPDKLHKYVVALSKYDKGTPVMFFLARVGRGAIKASQADEIEKFLINTGWKKNPNIRNIKGVGRPDWGIRGVLRGGKGKPNQSATKFKKLMDL